MKLCNNRNPHNRDLIASIAARSATQADVCAEYLRLTGRKLHPSSLMRAIRWSDDGARLYKPMPAVAVVEARGRNRARGRGLRKGVASE